MDDTPFIIEVEKIKGHSSPNLNLGSRRNVKLFHMHLCFWTPAFICVGMEVSGMESVVGLPFKAAT